MAEFCRSERRRPCGTRWAVNSRFEMHSVPVEIVEFISDAYPGFVAAQFTDAFGETHTFQDKVPIFTQHHLAPESPLPVAGSLGCEIMERFTENERDLARIDTERPWDVESTSGR